jgi:hypothetical protein
MYVLPIKLSQPASFAWARLNPCRIPNISLPSPNPLAGCSPLTPFPVPSLSVVLKKLSWCPVPPLPPVRRPNGLLGRAPTPVGESSLLHTPSLRSVQCELQAPLQPSHLPLASGGHLTGLFGIHISPVNFFWAFGLH